MYSQKEVGHAFRSASDKTDNTTKQRTWDQSCRNQSWTLSKAGPRDDVPTKLTRPTQRRGEASGTAYTGSSSSGSISSSGSNSSSGSHCYTIKERLIRVCELEWLCGSGSPGHQCGVIAPLPRLAVPKPVFRPQLRPTTLSSVLEPVVRDIPCTAGGRKIPV